MALKLPGAESFGSAPSGRSGKPIASYDTTAIGKGVAQLGAGIAGMGSGLSQASAQKKATVDKATAFETERRHLEFVSAQEKRLQEAGKQAQPGAFGFTEGYQQEYLAAAKDFMTSVPEELKPEYDVKLFRSEDGLVGRANTFEREQRGGYYKTKVGEGLTVIENKLYKNPKAFDENLAEGNRFIDTIPDDDVGPIEKDALRRDWKKKAQLAALNGMPAEERLSVLGEGQSVDIGTMGNGHDAAKALLRKKEGFRATPYWDVNAYRIGFGSDTITQADGSVVKVRQGMTVTRADAERDLDRRAAEFAQTAIRQVGAREWGALSASAQAALVSVTYNYGSLPATVVSSVKSGNVEAIASSVEGLRHHNGGVNAKRRASEAAMIRGGGSMPGDVPTEVDSRFADMTYGERETAVAAAKKDIAGRQEEAAAQAKAAYTLHDQALGLDIELGKVVSEAQIINDTTLDDGDILKHLKAFRTKQDKDADVRDLVTAVLAGDAEGAAVNHFASEERKVGDDAYEAMVKGVPEDQAEKTEALTQAYVQSTGYVPAAVQAQLRQGAASTDAGVLASALSRADALETLAPTSFNAFDGGSAVREKLSLFRHYVNDMGMSGADAAQRIIAMNDPSQQASREMLKPQVGDFLKSLSVAEVTDAFDPGILASEPGAGIMPVQVNGLLAEYREVAEQKFYQTGGDIGAAKALAVADLKKRWAVSTISGNSNLMRMPPELYYPAAGGGHDYLRDDAIKTAKEFVADAFPGREVENIAILPGSTTRGDVEAGRPPRYRLFYQYTEDGQAQFDEVVGAPWGLAVPDVEKATMSSRQKNKAAMLDAHKLDDTANEAMRLAESDAERALVETIGPDWMKARAAEGERELGRDRAATIRRNWLQERRTDSAKTLDHVEPLPETADSPQKRRMQTIRDNQWSEGF